MSTHWWRPLVWCVAGMAVGSIIVSTAWLLITVYQVTGDIRQTQESSRSILDYIKDCTEPEGKCYQASEARDAAQVGAFNAAVIATRYCADRLPDDYTIRDLTVCVGRHLHGKGHKR